MVLSVDASIEKIAKTATWPKGFGFKVASLRYALIEELTKEDKIIKCASLHRSLIQDCQKWEWAYQSFIYNRKNEQRDDFESKAIQGYRELKQKVLEFAKQRNAFQNSPPPVTVEQA